MKCFYHQFVLRLFKSILKKEDSWKKYQDSYKTKVIFHTHKYMIMSNIFLLKNYI